MNVIRPLKLKHYYCRDKKDSSFTSYLLRNRQKTECKYFKPRFSISNAETISKSPTTETLHRNMNLCGNKFEFQIINEIS